MSVRKQARDKITAAMLDELAESAPIEFQNDVLEEMGRGEHPGWTNAQVIGKKVVEEARKGKEWACSFIADRTEGRPAPAQVKRSQYADGVEDRISETSRQHLNQLASFLQPAAGPPAGTQGPAGLVGTNVVAGTQPAAQAGGGDPGGAGDSLGDSPDPARRLLGLPSDRPRGAQAAGGKPQLPPPGR